MNLRSTVQVLMLSVVVLTATSASHAGTATWVGSYNVQYNYGIGSLTLQEGVLGAGDKALVGQLLLRKHTGQKVTCSLVGPRPTDVRSDRVLLRGECKQGNQDIWHYLYLAKAPMGFHGYFTSHGTPPSTGGMINVPETDFKKLGFVTAIWGAGGPQPPEPGTGPPACPYYYVYDPELGAFVQQGEILRNLLGRETETMQWESIPWNLVGNGKLVISIREEKAEITHLDYVAVRVGNTFIPAEGNGSAIALIAARDGSYLTMHMGDELTLEFDLSRLAKTAPIQLLSAGYYTSAVP